MLAETPEPISGEPHKTNGQKWFEGLVGFLTGFFGNLLLTLLLPRYAILANVLFFAGNIGLIILLVRLRKKHYGLGIALNFAAILIFFGLVLIVMKLMGGAPLV